MTKHPPTVSSKNIQISRYLKMESGDNLNKI